MKKIESVYTICWGKTRIKLKKPQACKIFKNFLKKMKKRLDISISTHYNRQCSAQEKILLRV